MRSSLRTESPIRRLLVLLCVSTVAAGCSAPRHADRADEIVEQPTGESGDAAVEGIGADAWCSDFGHPGLQEVIERAWTDNPELKAAWSRLEQAEAVARSEASSLWPTAEATADAGASNEGGLTEGGAERGAGTYWELSGAASYEVDLWGRHRRRADAADLEADAAEASARSVAISLTSRVAEAWFDVVAHRRRVQLLERQIEVSEEILSISRERARRGLTPALDIAQQERNIESIRGRLSTARGQLRTSRHRLAVLTGNTPDTEIAVDDEGLPELEPLSDAGVPADLLERRPDIRAAHLQLRAADERTAAAVADRLPRLQLNAAIGLTAFDPSSILSGVFWNIGAGLTQPLFQGGRLQAEIDRNEAVAEEQLYNYADTLLAALREVRDALVLEETQHEQIRSLESQLDTAREALEMARQQYRTGAVDYLRVLTALEGVQQVERSLIDARRQQVSNRIAVCRALGGSWVDSVEPSIEMDEDSEASP